MSKIDTNSQGCGIPESADPALRGVGETPVWHAPVLTVADCDETEASDASYTDSGVLS